MPDSTVPSTVGAWHAFWDSLQDASSGADAVALLEALGSRPPDPGSAGALVASLDERRSHPEAVEAVNIVGSGGGPKTFNLSTAAALVAAAIGVRVVKSGSRAYTSRYGSIDALKLLGVPLAGSHDEVADTLERCGIAFPGAFVYPPELALLARRTFPRDWRTLGGVFNRLGPFLAAVPANAQLTGVSDRALLPLYEQLAVGRRVWLCFNACGVDELVSFEANTIRDDGSELRLDPVGPGTLAGLAGASDAVSQLTALLGGEGPPAALDSICLNAAGMAVLGGVEPDWGEAFREARRALDAGAALDVLERLRRHA